MDALTRYQELNEVSVLSCDLFKFPIDEFDRLENSINGRPYYTARCICNTVLFDSNLTTGIKWKEVQMCSTNVEDIQEGHQV
jgi:hypothetical protein